MTSSNQKSPLFGLNGDHFEALFKILVTKGYTVVGPTYKSGALTLAEISQFVDLPKGKKDKHHGGRVSVDEEEGDGWYFNYVVGPLSLKNFLNPSRHRLWTSSKDSNGRLKFEMDEAPKKKYAFIGIRSCDLDALKIQSKVFGGEYPNAWFQQLKKKSLIISTSCNRPSENCFCTTMGGGPNPQTGYDINLNEVEPGVFVASYGSKTGRELLEILNLEASKDEMLLKQDQLLKSALELLKPRFDTEKVRDHLKNKLEDNQWEEIANKCLSCANCTMVCPTCFCTTTEEINDLEGNHTERWLTWDSCFNQGYSYIHGAQIRNSTKSRYRQWMTHKLSNWYDQFDSSGCVGCGRCITWCPVGIDISKEATEFEKS